MFSSSSATTPPGGGGVTPSSSFRRRKPKLVVEESSPLLDTPPGSPAEEDDEEDGNEQRRHVEPRVLYNPLSCPEAVLASVASFPTTPSSAVMAPPPAAAAAASTAVLYRNGRGASSASSSQVVVLEPTYPWDLEEDEDQDRVEMGRGSSRESSEYVHPSLETRKQRTLSSPFLLLFSQPDFQPRLPLIHSLSLSHSHSDTISTPFFSLCSSSPPFSFCLTAQSTQMIVHR